MMWKFTFTHTHLDEVPGGHAPEQRQMVDATGNKGTSFFKDWQYSPPSWCAAASDRYEKPACMHMTVHSCECIVWFCLESACIGRGMCSCKVGTYAPVSICHELP